MSNTKAELVLKEQRDVLPNSFVQQIIWRVPVPVLGCTHHYKYRLAYIVAGKCVLRYDNERGKGDHRHFVEIESDYEFISLERLNADFDADVGIWNRWRSR